MAYFHPSSLFPAVRLMPRSRCFSILSSKHVVCQPQAPVRPGWSGWSASVRTASTQHIQTTSSALKSRVYLLNRQTPEVIDLPEAVRALQAYSLSEIPETVELSVQVEMALRRGKTRDIFRGTLIYPNRFGSQSKILLLAEDSVGIKTGADIVGGEDIIKKLEAGDPDLDFDVCLCTPDMYEKIKHLQKKLRTKMPNPRRGTVVQLENMKQAVLKFQQSREFKCNKHGYINMPVGKLDFSESSLSRNIQCLVDSVGGHRQHLPKASFIKRATLSTTYGPGFRLNLTQYL